MQQRLLGDENRTPPLDATLTEIDRAAEAAAKALASGRSAVKRLGDSSRQGRLRDLPKAIDQLNDSLSALRAATEAAATILATTGITGRVDADSYLTELARVASESGLEYVELGDGELLSFPVVVKFDSKEQKVLIGRKSVGSIRPTLVVKTLKQLRDKPRAAGDQFLNALEKAYLRLTSGQTGKSVLLQEVYDLLTLRPGQTKDYDLMDFLMDVYVLDRSGSTVTKQRRRLEFHAGTAARGGRGFRIVTERGTEKLYATLTFIPEHT